MAASAPIVQPAPRTKRSTPTLEVKDLRVEFATDRPPLTRQALFVRPELSLASDLASSLGVKLTEVGSVEKTVPLRFCRNPSKSPKKNALFLTIGPPSTPPYWLRRSPSSCRSPSRG